MRGSTADRQLGQAVEEHAPRGGGIYHRCEIERAGTDGPPPRKRGWGHRVDHLVSSGSFPARARGGAPKTSSRHRRSSPVPPARAGMDPYPRRASRQNDRSAPRAREYGRKPGAAAHVFRGFSGRPRAGMNAVRHCRDALAPGRRAREDQPAHRPDAGPDSRSTGRRRAGASSRSGATRRRRASTARTVRSL